MDSRRFAGAGWIKLLFGRRWLVGWRSLSGVQDAIWWVVTVRRLADAQENEPVSRQSIAVDYLSVKGARATV